MKSLDETIWEIHRRQVLRKKMNGTSYPHVAEARERRRMLKEASAELSLWTVL